MNSQNTPIWIIDDDRSIRWVLEKALEKAGFSTKTFDNAGTALKQLKQHQPIAVVSDVRMPGIDGLDLLGQLQAQFPHIPVIIITAHSDLNSAVAAYQGGAFEYLPKPFDIDEAIAVIRRAVAHSLETKQSAKASMASDPIQANIIGEAPSMQKVFRAIGRLSQSTVTVLINGESGTGKELVAHALHHHSPRKSNPFIALNMAAMPKELVDSELFGHEKGAFTGATSLRQGHFEQANGGTLFLDEIGDMPADTQTRLLRVIADGEFYRVGGHTPIKVDVRIIAATHQDLEALVSTQDFREDLFHRINVIRIHMPPLVDRREDIPQLAHFFLKKSAQSLGVDPKVLHPEAEDSLCRFNWPGNVRQLENTCHWMTVMGSGREIHTEDLPPEILNACNNEEPSTDWEKSLHHWADKALAQGGKNILSDATPVFEKTLINVALKHTSGRKRDAAKLLGWGRNTLTRKLKELEISDTNDIDVPK